MGTDALDGLAYGGAESAFFETGRGYVSIARTDGMPNPLEEWDTVASYLTWERDRISPQLNGYLDPEAFYESVCGRPADGMGIEEIARELSREGHLCEVIYRGADDRIGLSDMPYATSRPWAVGLAFASAADLAQEGISAEHARDLAAAELSAYSAWVCGDLWIAEESDELGRELGAAVFYGLDDVEANYPSLSPVGPAEQARLEGAAYISPKGDVLLASFERADGGRDALVFRPAAVQKYVVARDYDPDTGEWSSGRYYSDPMHAWADADPDIFEESLVVWGKDDVRAALEREGMPDEGIETAAEDVAFDADRMKGWRDWAVQEGNDELCSVARRRRAPRAGRVRAEGGQVRRGGEEQRDPRRGKVGEWGREGARSRARRSIGPRTRPQGSASAPFPPLPETVCRGAARASRGV